MATGHKHFYFDADTCIEINAKPGRHVMTEAVSERMKKCITHHMPMIILIVCVNWTFLTLIEDWIHAICSLKQ